MQIKNKLVYFIFVIFFAYLCGDSLRCLKADWHIYKAITTNINHWRYVVYHINKSLQYAPEHATRYKDRTGIIIMRKVVIEGNKDLWLRGRILLNQAHKSNPYSMDIVIRIIGLDMVALEKGIIPELDDYTKSAVMILYRVDHNNPIVQRVFALLRHKIRVEDGVYKIKK